MPQFYINWERVERSFLAYKHRKLSSVSFEHWINCGVRNCSIQVTSFLINIVLLGLSMCRCEGHGFQAV